MKKIGALFLILFITPVFSYTPSNEFESYSIRLSDQLNHLLARMKWTEKNTFLVTIGNRLDDLQNNLIGKDDIKSRDRMYLLEYLRRKISWLGSFSESRAIYDELDSVIWNQVSQGFDILYSPFETPSVQNSDTDKQYSVLLNGGYFNRVDGARYYAGLLAIHGERQTPFVPDDPQITHSVCIDVNGRVSFIPNENYQESLITSCTFLFQWGPLLYSLHGWISDENLMSWQYLWRAHKRTVMVVFEKNMEQDTWFITVNEEVTLAEVKNIVLRETRFFDTYDWLDIFNLDGGSSVAHVNRLHPELNIGRTKILPIVIGIK